MLLLFSIWFFFSVIFSMWLFISVAFLVTPKNLKKIGDILVHMYMKGLFNLIEVLFFYHS